MPRYNRRDYLKAAGIAGAAGLTGFAGCTGGGGGGGGTPTINFNYVVPIENAASLLAVPEIRENLENAGSAYELNVTRNSGTPTSLNQMAAGSADVVMTSTVSFASAVNQSAVPEGLSVVGVDFWDAAPENYDVSVFAAPDSGITSISDLEGKTVAVNALGTGVHSVYVKGLRSAGLSRDDVEFVEMGFPTYTSALNEGKIDAGIYPALFAVGARSEGFNRVFGSADVWSQQYPFTYATASKRALNNKPDAMAAWAEDYAGLFDYVRNNRSEAASAAASHFELPASTVESYFFTENDYHRDLTVDQDALQFIIDDLVELDFIDESFDVTEHSTNEFQN
ncbi:ABC transporter substrate-binding protein [Halarchaeum nitratireducens]|uniref:ABC transporter substrate-binding protein n=1 Tax=Halarchaeum nitratireducens TaxID=489913 RepID=A0A830G8X7_9EURY|nr:MULTISPECIES: ABC transporter substrate-binding protein [Halarchaeum]MBP2249861.1 NitT/TauT family transport system substrate-binding protein [Halarchaeum solikamskense]GGN10094.1 ABC transporter substrate-binding protein [Halarchaeum nitratireducens]